MDVFSKPLKIETGTIYIRMPDFPKVCKGSCVKTVRARDDNIASVNLDYDKKGKLIGIEVLSHGYNKAIDMEK